MEAAQREMNDDRRLELLRQVHRMLAADQPADFWWDADQYWGIAKRLQGVQTSPFGLFHFLRRSVAILAPRGLQPLGRQDFRLVTIWM